MTDPHKPITIRGHQIAPSLLEAQPICRCDIAVCQARCCSDGVWVDSGQAGRIVEHAGLIAPLLPPDRRDPAGWFAEPYVDPHAPSGRYIGTTTVADSTHPNGSTCVFLRPEDRFCAIQAASIANGLEPWALKPYYCCLFPLVDEWDGQAARLLLDSDNDLFERGGGCRAQSQQARPVFQVYAEEVALVLGVDGYRDLCRQAGEQPRL